MHWLLQENIYDEDGHDSLVNILKRTKTPHSFHKIVPFVGELIPDIKLENPVVCFGSYSLRHTAKLKGWTPGVWNLEDCDYKTCILHWKSEMLNHDAAIFELQDFPNLIKNRDDAFYRPCGDSKHFSGGVYKYEKIEELVNNTLKLKDDEVYYGLGPNTLIIRASLRGIIAEYRTWIIEGRVVTASQYKLGDRVVYFPLLDDDVISYARKMIAIWEPKQAFVLDICRTPWGLKIMEINTINAAGFYAANMYKIFEAIENLKGEF